MVSQIYENADDASGIDDMLKAADARIAQLARDRPMPRGAVR